MRFVTWFFVLLTIGVVMCDEVEEEEYIDMDEVDESMHNKQAYNAQYVGNKIVAAVNCGGPPHEDINGIKYNKDFLEGSQGIASDHGRRFLIARVPQPDQVLYQTERYSLEDMTYDFQVPDDGKYVLVLKFSEVYFSQPNMKVFDVAVNEDHLVVSDLDIFSAVGLGIAHDELIPFSINDKKLTINGQASDFTGKFSVKFIKKTYDNPKINAIYIMKGTLQDVPNLQPLTKAVDEEEEVVEEEVKRETQPTEPSKFASGPKLSDPYATQDHSHMFIPILIALACFFPVLFCLCKL